MIKWTPKEIRLVRAFIALYRARRISIYLAIQDLDDVLTDRSRSSIYSKFQREKKFLK